MRGLVSHSEEAFGRLGDLAHLYGVPAVFIILLPVKSQFVLIDDLTLQVRDLYAQGLLVYQDTKLGGVDPIIRSGFFLPELVEATTG